MTDLGGERARRALLWMAVAALGLAAAGVVYLRPGLNAQPARPAPGAVAALQPDLPAFITVSFGDADHGAMQLFTPGRVYRVVPIYLTFDGGRTWRHLEWSTNDIAAIAFVGPRRVLAETLRGATLNLAVSEDGGLTWKPSAGRPGSLNVVGAWPSFVGPDGWWLDVRPAGPGPSVPQFGGLWHSADGGRTWARLEASGIPGTSYIGQLQFVDPRHGALIVGALHGYTVVATSDGGHTWQPAAIFDLPVPGSFTWGISLVRHGSRLLFSLAVSLADPRIPSNSLGAITLDTFTSVSDDGGATWGPLRAGPVTTYTTAGQRVAFDERGKLLLLDGRRLWVSDDGGATWSSRVAVAPAGLTPAVIVAVVPGSIYATATRQISAQPPSGLRAAALLRSTDGGIHWNEVRLPQP